MNEKNAYLEQFQNNYKKKFFENPVRDYIFVIMLMPPKSSNPVWIELFKHIFNTYGVVVEEGRFYVTNIYSRWEFQGIY